jgi:hypothetical protein
MYCFRDIYTKTDYLYIFSLISGMPLNGISIEKLEDGEQAIGSDLSI